MRGDLLGSMGKQQARCITARRSLPAGRDRNLRSRFAPLQAPFPLAAGRDRNLRSRFAPLQAPFPLAAGALAKLWRHQGVARLGEPLFRFGGAGLVKASFQRPGPQNEISIAFAMLTP